ncbi:MAG: AmmeMemoRadiSam system radical SAM enzyme [Methanobacterium sp.]
MKREVLVYDKIGENLNCKVCERRCVIKKGNVGFCGMRKNIGDKLCAINYAAASSVAVDPIEKKPLFHFYPGTTVFSIGSVGCNFKCKHCQNWNISQADLEKIPTREIPPEDAIRLTKQYGCKSIAWTYNEPTMWFEYTYDCAKLAKKEGISTVYVTNGYMSEESFDLIKPYLDAANIDLKGMNDKFYRGLCEARLQPVLDTIKRMYDNKIHIEITNLMIPGYNDSEEDIKALLNFLIEETGVEVPLHFTRFFPYYELGQLPPTPVESLRRAYDMAKEAGMQYVYIGNVSSGGEESTLCPECGKVLIERNGFEVSDDKLRQTRKCPACEAPINIIT